MHDTAYEIGRTVFQYYARPNSVIVDLGACNMNGSLRDFQPDNCLYIGIDLVVGPGVDIVAKAGMPLPIADASADLVVATSVFEHDQFFWETFVDLARVLKPGGVLYMNSPSNGRYHRYPNDYWRFYPDCGLALEAWAHKNGQAITMVESFTALRKSDIWNDFAALFVKGTEVEVGTLKFVSEDLNFSSAWRLGRDNSLKGNEFPVEDMTIIKSLQDEVARLRLAIPEHLSAPPAHTDSVPISISALRARLENSIKAVNRPLDIQTQPTAPQPQKSETND